MTKKTLYIIIGVSGAVVIGGIIAAIVIATKKDSTNKDDINVKDKTQDKINADNPQVNAPFPLKKGSKGANVTNLNMALGLAPSNVFSDETEATLVHKYNKKEVTKKDYDFFYNMIKKYV